jgi:hypothetical protein
VLRCNSLNPAKNLCSLAENTQHFYDVPYISLARNKAERSRRILEFRESSDPSKRERVAKFDRARHDAESDSNFVRESGRFPLTAVGDVNTYALFAELGGELSSEHGRVGLLLPSGIATDDTTKRFFGDLIDNKLLVEVAGYENEEFLFPAVHHSFKFCRLTFAGTSRSAPAALVFLCRRYQDARDARKRFTLTPEEFSLLNPLTKTCPVFRTGADASLTKKIYRSVPTVSHESADHNGWGVTYSTMFHMAADSELFHDAPGQGLLPLYEAKMFRQFDHRFGTFADATASNLNAGILPQPSSTEKRDRDFEVLPRYWVEYSEVKQRLRDWNHDWLFAFRDVTSSVVERTAIFSVIPLSGVGHNAPLLFVRPALFELIPCLLANFNSVVFDFVARQKLGGNHLTYGVLNQLPVIAPQAYKAEGECFVKERALRLMFTSNSLKAFGAEFHQITPSVWDDDERRTLRAELDAYYAHLYGLTGDELRYILDPKDVFGDDFPSETFRILKERETKEFGEYRTQRLVLEAYDELAKSDRFRDEMPHRVSAIEATPTTVKARSHS